MENHKDEHVLTDMRNCSIKLRFLIGFEHLKISENNKSNWWADNDKKEEQYDLFCCW